MTTEHPADYLVSLARELCRLTKETEWLEFKVNDVEPEDIGEYISALSNSAALAGKAFAYLVWGVADHDHAIVGTTFDPHSAKVGNEELENWLLRLLSPKIHFHFFEVMVDGKSVVLLEIERAFRHPVQFRGQELVRVGSYKKKLKDFPEKERALWRIFDRTPFEDGVAAERIPADRVLGLLDYPSYFDLLKRPLPENRPGILEALSADALIRSDDAGGWSITNLGAILFAKKLEDFRPLRRKAVRVIQYRGTNRLETVRERVGAKGYASGFEGLIGFINGLLPSIEVIGQALRQTVTVFPEPAVRELVANALIHQDFFITGTGPMVEIFEDRIEITNPGAPLVDTDRFVDTAPKSRNEALASLMRRMGICEERGSGWDKVVAATEVYQLPAPLIEVPGDSTRVVLFAPRPLSKMDKADRVRAVYLHACLRYVSHEHLTNASVRQRFGIEPKNIATASRVIREAVEAGVIVPYDPGAAPKLMRYVPVWAAPHRGNGT
jgi:ATP-dependent DNA helicase RecG